MNRRRTHNRRRASSIAPIVPPAAHFNHYMRRCMAARAAILALVDALVLHGYTAAQAIGTVVALARAHALPASVARLVPVANARAGRSRTLARSTLYCWRAQRAKARGAESPKAPADLAKPRHPKGPDGAEWTPILTPRAR